METNNMFSDFYGRVVGREYLTVEINCVQTESALQTEDAICDFFDDFRIDTAEKGLFAGDLKMEGSHMLQNGYPIYRKGAGETAAAAMASLRDFGIESFGRQGG